MTSWSVTLVFCWNDQTDRDRIALTPRSSVPLVTWRMVAPRPSIVRFVLAFTTSVPSTRKQAAAGNCSVEPSGAALMAAWSRAVTSTEQSAGMSEGDATTAAPAAAGLSPTTAVTATATSAGRNTCEKSTHASSTIGAVALKSRARVTTGSGSDGRDDLHATESDAPVGACGSAGAETTGAAYEDRAHAHARAADGHELGDVGAGEGE